MKYVLSALMIIMINAQARAASFIEGLEDVPVMEGMKQVPSDSILVRQRGEPVGGSALNQQQGRF